MSSRGLGVLLVLVGLPGSGKSTYLNACADRDYDGARFDDFQGRAIEDRGDPWWSRQMLPVFDLLRSGRSVTVSDIRFCDARELRILQEFFTGHLPELPIERLYFANQPEVCERNVRYRWSLDGVTGEPKWPRQIANIYAYSKVYEPPRNAMEVVPVIGPLREQAEASIWAARRPSRARGE